MKPRHRKKELEAAEAAKKAIEDANRAKAGEKLKTHNNNSLYRRVNQKGYDTYHKL